MFNNIIYFITVLLIFHISYILNTSYPDKGPDNSLFYTILMLILGWTVFAALCRWSFHRLLDRHRRGLEKEGRLAGEYQGLVLRLSMLAIFLFALDVLVFYMTYWLQFIPGLKHFSVLQGASALLAFILYLSTIWYFAYPAYLIAFRADFPRRSFIISNIKLNIPILFPWATISLAHDLLAFTSLAGPDGFLRRPEGQLLFFTSFLIVLVIFLPQLIQYWWQCRPFKPSDKVRALKAFLKEKNMKYRDLLRWPIFEGRMMTAGIMGVVPRYRYILITDALMEVLSVEELKAVVAHEMGHAKYRHMLFYVFFFLGFIGLTIGLFDASFFDLFMAYVAVKFSVKVSLHTQLFLYGLTILATILIYFRYVMGFFMRNFERQADLHSAAIMGSPRPTISSLEKIALLSGKSREVPSWHHFSIKERVDYLWRTLSKPTLAKRHHRFVAHSFLAYTVCIIGLGYLFNFSPFKQTIAYKVVSKALEQHLTKEPNNLQHLYQLARVYHELGRFQEAIQNYEKTILLDQTKAGPLNDLAWLLLTAEDESVRDRKRALVLARKAVALERSAMILDTLAEAYYANGLNREAVETITEAISLAKEGRGYYEKQLEKFRRDMVNR